MTIPAVSVVGLFVAPDPLTLDAGQNAQFTATERLSDGGTRDATRAVQWLADAPGVATVGATGRAQGLAAGVARITATHPSGLSASATLTVTRRLHIAVSVTPVPLAIPPDGTASTFTIRLSEPDAIAHTVNLSIADRAVASVAPASVTFASGQTTAQASITGLSGGQTTLVLTSSSLAPASVPVLVTTEFRGINTALAPLLGVLVQQAPQPPLWTTVGPVQSAAVGVVLGSAILGLTPPTVIVGTGPTPVVIRGARLAGVTSVTIEPATGLTLGSPVAAADGTSITIPITVAGDAPLGLRQVVVAASGQRIPPTTANADRLLVSLPAPTVESIDPLFATPGTTAMTLTVRGHNLQGAQALSFSPADGVTVGVPTVTSDGTQLSVAVSISSAAPAGARVVTVRTPGGVSDSTPSPANTFTIVSAVRETITPVVAPVLGVVKETPTVPSSQTLSLVSPAVGIARGAIATAIGPSSGVVGTTVTLTVEGHGLEGLTAIDVVPATGLVVGVPMVAADGRSASVELAIAPDAPQSLRTVQVLAGAAPIVFANAAAALFRVTAPAPRIDSVSPIVLQTGATAVELTLRGVNFENAERVDILPPTDIAVSPPTVAADGTTATVAITVASTAVTGPRVVTITTPAARTSAVAAPANTITLATVPGTTVTPVVAPLLGVVKSDQTPPGVTPIGPIVSPALGVTVEATPSPPASFTGLLASPALGVAVGAVATSVEPRGVAPGTSGALTIRGFGLTSATGVALTPAGGITLGTPAVSADGREVAVPFAVDASEPGSIRTVTLATATGTVDFATPDAALVHVHAIPVIESISPIVLCADTASVRMTIRGQHLLGAIAVTATPPDGITVGSTVAVTIEGPQGFTTDAATVNLAITSDAPLGGRVVRVIVPGFASTDQAEPANTFTVNDRPRPDTAGVCPGVAGGGG